MKLSVLNPMNSLQSNHGYKVVKMSTVSVHTLAVEYATDKHAVLIKWKVRQCWRQSEQY